MKRLFTLLLLVTTFSSQIWAFDPNNQRQEDFLSNINENIELRIEGIKFYEQNKHKFGNADSLTHEDLENIYNFSQRYIAHRARLLQHIEKVQDKIGIYDLVRVTTSEVTRQKRNWYGRKIHVLNPSERAGKRKIRSINMATIYGLVLFDNYLTLIAPYYSHDKIRYLLNRDFPGGKKQIDKITDNFFSWGQRKSLGLGLKVFEDIQTVVEAEEIKQSSFDNYLNEIIKSSPIRTYLKSEGNLDDGRVKFLLTRLSDELRFLTRGSTYQTSKLFGNLMGRFQSREGLMKKFNDEQRRDISSRLKPLDILLEKTPFRLTDDFIPGYYGHVAIWAGTEEELKELGLWDHPIIRPHQKKISSGHHIIEALRPGVQINTLEHFLDIDDLAVIRPNDLSSEQTEEYLVRAFAQIGKAYDFNFDVETDKLIVCSEIAYVVYHNVKWPTDRVMGRSTISPDHVAWQAIPGKAFTPVLVFKNGVEIEDEVAELFYANISGPEGLSEDEMNFEAEDVMLADSVAVID